MCVFAYMFKLGFTFNLSLSCIYIYKFHLKFLEAIYISMNHSSLCRQLNNHTLNILGELLDTGGDLVFLGGFSTLYLAIQII